MSIFRFYLFFAPTLSKSLSPMNVSLNDSSESSLFTSIVAKFKLNRSFKFRFINYILCWSNANILAANLHLNYIKILLHDISGWWFNYYLCQILFTGAWGGKIFHIQTISSKHEESFSIPSFAIFFQNKSLTNFLRRRRLCERSYATDF